MITELYPHSREIPLRYGLAALVSTLLFVSILLFRNEEMAEFVLILSPLPLALLVNPLYQMQKGRAPTESRIAQGSGLLGAATVIAVSIFGLIAAYFGYDAKRLGSVLSMLCLSMMSFSAVWMALTSWLMIYHPSGRRLVQFLGLYGLAASTYWFALLVSTIGYAVGNASTDVFLLLSGANVIVLLFSFFAWTVGLLLALLGGLWL